ncbi:Hypothetical protein LDBND_0232 [Lactobacillus delbrueckii subsp. bulgaricus ND02]|nr:Hypothetical protein LDBND_0232 [Lactobacillus delbrueckii subsp. bulgaricus ND02]
MSNSFNFAVIPLLAAGDVGVLEVPSPRFWMTPLTLGRIKDAVVL